MVGKEINIMRLDKPNMIKGLMYLISDVNAHFQCEIEMIEVGSNIGESTLMFKNALGAKKIHCVDMWGKFEEVFDMMTCRSTVIKKHKTHSRNKRLQSIGKVDFVYIGSSNKYEDVKADIGFYLPFLNSGGIIAGHNFSPIFEGVMKAVTEAFSTSNITLYEDTSWLVKL